MKYKKANINERNLSEESVSEYVNYIKDKITGNYEEEYKEIEQLSFKFKISRPENQKDILHKIVDITCYCRDNYLKNKDEI